MMISIRSLLLLMLVPLFFGSVSFGQQYKSWFFFAPKDLAERKIIPASELRACLLGEVYLPPNHMLFKQTLDTGTQTQAGLMKRKLCDVALIFNLSVAEEKLMAENYPGFAIYKISGTDLELSIYPKDVSYVAVAGSRFASAQTLLKSELLPTGASSLRNLFAPSRNSWKESWSDWNAPIGTLTKENVPVDHALRDVWIMSLEDYMTFLKRVGSKYPVFDVYPEKDELKRRR